MSKRPIVHITDHAVIRYLERVENQDIALVRRAIHFRLDRALGAAAEIGLASNCAVVAPEAIYVIAGGSLVTVLTTEHPVSRRQRETRVVADGDDG